MTSLAHTASTPRFRQPRGHLRAYLAGVGATTALTSGALVVFLSLATFVAFKGLPFGGSSDGGAALPRRERRRSRHGRDGARRGTQRRCEGSLRRLAWRRRDRPARRPWRRQRLHGPRSGARPAPGAAHPVAGRLAPAAPRPPGHPRPPPCPPRRGHRSASHSRRPPRRPRSAPGIPLRFPPRRRWSPRARPARDPDPADTRTAPVPTPPLVPFLPAPPLFPTPPLVPSVPAAADPHPDLAR